MSEICLKNKNLLYANSHKLLHKRDEDVYHFSAVPLCIDGCAAHSLSRLSTGFLVNGRARPNLLNTFFKRIFRSGIQGGAGCHSTHRLTPTDGSLYCFVNLFPIIIFIHILINFSLFVKVYLHIFSFL